MPGSVPRMSTTQTIKLAWAHFLSALATNPNFSVATRVAPAGGRGSKLTWGYTGVRVPFIWLRHLENIDIFPVVIQFLLKPTRKKQTSIANGGYWSISQGAILHPIEPHPGRPLKPPRSSGGTQ